MRRIIRGSGFAVFTVLAGVLFAPASGLAAPQVLPLIATEGAVALNCAGAEFSSFCLQQNRTSPARGTAYRIVGSGTLAVTGTTSDGATMALDSDSLLKFESLRTHVAVRIAVPQSVMRRHGLQSVSVQIGKNVTLAPIPTLGDDNPQDEGSLAMASGPLRAIGASFVDANETRMAAARLTSRMINDINARREARSLSIGDVSTVSAGARTMVRGAPDFCRFAAQHRLIRGIKGCLQEHHDKFIGYLNSAYWTATGAGS